jgi:hypothetical protein
MPQGGATHVAILEFSFNASRHATSLASRQALFPLAGAAPE